MIKDLILKNRSYRRFYEDQIVERQTLLDLVDLARLSPSSANLQPLKYFISCDTKTNARIFPWLGWAGYLSDWDGPQEGERPAAYIIILGDATIKERINCDHGIAAQSILLGATEKGLGGCIIASIKRDELRKTLSIPNHLQILLVLALGKPREKVVLEQVGADGNIEYWRDANGVHHVPKRALSDIVVNY